jgi:hypothetical protein
MTTTTKIRNENDQENAYNYDEGDKDNKDTYGTTTINLRHDDDYIDDDNNGGNKDDNDDYGDKHP